MLHKLGVSNCEFMIPGMSAVMATGHPEKTVLMLTVTVHSLTTLSAI